MEGGLAWAVDVCVSPAILVTHLRLGRKEARGWELSGLQALGDKSVY